MSSFQQEIMRHLEKQDSIIFEWEIIVGNKTTFKVTQMLDIADKDFSAAIINAFENAWFQAMTWNQMHAWRIKAKYGNSKE